MKLSYRLTSSLVLVAFALSGCFWRRGPSVEDELNESTIAYPFVEETHPLGASQFDEKFVIRSAVGKTEYTVEIPGAARDYDVEVPLAEISEMDSGDTAGRTRSERELRPQTTDRELVADMPKVQDGTNPHLTDSAFGVGNKKGPEQSPSYTLGIARVTKLYQDHKYEYALIEINNLLAFYPTAAKVHKMKGTVLMKLRSFSLAERAWERALELSPNDLALRRGLKRLRDRIAADEKAAIADKTLDVPRTPATGVPPPETLQAH